MACPPDLPERSSRFSSLLRQWAVPIAELAIRLAVIVLTAHLLLSLPLPLEGTCLTLAQALIVLVAVILIGITLLETLFYNHYRP
jgi:hypothetical protein